MRRLKGQTVSTICFLLLAGLFLYACTLLVGSVMRQELLRAPSVTIAPNPATSPMQQRPGTPAPTETLKDAVAIFVPNDGEQSPLPNETPDPMASATIPTPTPTPTPAAATPAPTLLPLRDPPAFAAHRADFVLVAFDKETHADWVAVVSVRDQVISVLSVPRNTLSASGTPLRNATKVNYAMDLLRTIWPVEYPYYVELQLEGLPQCVDQFGGVLLNGKQQTGVDVEAYLNNSPSDELLRITRQQEVMQAYLSQLQQTGWLKLLASKFSLEKYLDSNLSTAKLLELYTHFKDMDVNQIRFATLPVDSVTENGSRYYTPDVVLVNRMLQEQTGD